MVDHWLNPCNSRAYEWYIDSFLANWVKRTTYGLNFKITRKLYEDLEARLSASDYLAGKEYSIADIATWSWIARHKRHDIGLENFKGLSRWYVDIAKRPAVIKGFKVLNKDAEIDYP